MHITLMLMQATMTEQRHADCPRCHAISWTNLVTDWAVHLLLVQLLTVTTPSCILLCVLELLLVEGDAAADAGGDIRCSFLTLQD